MSRRVVPIVTVVCAVAFFLPVALAASPRRPTASPSPSRAHFCWIERVEVQGTGVQIRFAKDVPLPSGQTTVHGDPGTVFRPATSGHDGCTVTVARKSRQLGVDARAHLFVPAFMTEPDVRSEWIPADRPSPRRPSRQGSFRQGPSH